MVTAYINGKLLKYINHAWIDEDGLQFINIPYSSSVDSVLKSAFAIESLKKGMK